MRVPPAFLSASGSQNLLARGQAVMKNLHRMFWAGMVPAMFCVFIVIAHNPDFLIVDHTVYWLGRRAVAVVTQVRPLVWSDLLVGCAAVIGVVTHVRSSNPYAQESEEDKPTRTVVRTTFLLNFSHV